MLLISCAKTIFWLVPFLTIQSQEQQAFQWEFVEIRGNLISIGRI